MTMIPLPLGLPGVSTAGVALFMAGTVALPLIAAGPAPRVRAFGAALLLAAVVAVSSIIIPNCCPTWCWLEPVCWW